MRQVGTFPEETLAVRFAHYLQSLGIPGQVDSMHDGFGVWVYDETNLARARTELNAFLTNPADAKYPAAPAVQALAPERRHIQADASPHAAPTMGRRLTSQEMAHSRVTWLLLAASVAITLWTGFGQNQARSNDFWIARVQVHGNHVTWDHLNDIFERGEAWRLVTPIFVHMGWPHLIFNMLMLVDLGRVIETLRGSVRYAILVLVLAVASNLAQYRFGGPNFTYGGPLFGGMSGVLYGLFGYAWMKSWLDPNSDVVLSKEAVFMMLGWFVACVVGIIPHVANLAHAGGLAAGMVIGSAAAAWSRFRD